MNQRKLHCYHKICEQITQSPGIPIYEIASNTDISRNTVSKYLQEMVEDSVLIGPQLRLLPSSTYKQYVYLMDFKNPYHLYHNLRGFPHVLCHAMTFGDWNAMVITDTLVDFSQLVGFENVFFQGVRYHSYTPETAHISWSKGFERCSHQIERFTPHKEYKNRTLAPALTWGEDQWKMYYAFKDNARKTATTTLKQIGVRYEEYVKWMEDLKTHCTYHTGFYPDGYYTYLTYCFLFSTDYEQTVKNLFSSFPTTPFIMEVGDNILVFSNIVISKLKRKLFCSIYDMKTQGIIKTFNHASLIFQTASSNNMESCFRQASSWFIGHA